MKVRKKYQFFSITQVLSKCNLNFLRNALRISRVYFLTKLLASVAVQKIIRISHFYEEKQMFLSFEWYYLIENLNHKFCNRPGPCFFLQWFYSIKPCSHLIFWSMSWRGDYGHEVVISIGNTLETFLWKYRHL